MKITVFLFLIASLNLLMLCPACSGSEKGGQVETSASGAPGDNVNKTIQAGVRTEKRNGVTHIFNPSTPLKGELPLELEKIVEIDSQNIEPETPVFFHMAVRNDIGNIYISDMYKVEIFGFNHKGELADRFLRKGEGPGEYPYGAYTIQPRNKNIWVPGTRKIIRFSVDGKLLEEIKFKKKYRNIEVIDENRFVVNYFLFDGDRKDTKPGNRKSVCALINREETVLASYFSAADAGSTEVYEKIDGRVFRLSFSMNAITPTIHHRFDPEHERFYLCLSSAYSIFMKDLKGGMQKVIHREHRNRSLSPGDRAEIVDTFFGKRPPHEKEIIRKHLPNTFCAVSGLHVLPGGFFAVSRVTGIETLDIDVFDQEGRYIYQLKFPEEMPQPDLRLYFHGDTVSFIHTVDDRDIYTLYRIKWKR